MESKEISILQRDSRLTEIAREHLEMETLKMQRHDFMDFYELAVWQIRAALVAAYEAGRGDSKGQ